MQGMFYPVTFHFGGTLAANQQGAFQLPSGMTLKEISAVGSNANDATLQVGTSADADGVLTAAAIGDSDTPVVFDKDDWDGALVTSGEPYHLADNTIVTFVLDYDGSSGTAAANVTIVFTFIEG